VIEASCHCGAVKLEIATAPLMPVTFAMSVS
jgi:hypothetical protein